MVSLPRLEKHVSGPPFEGRGQRLPRALLELVPDRLARLGLAYAIAYFLAVLTGEFIHHVFGNEPYALHPHLVVAFCCILLGLGVRALARSPRLSAEQLVNVGLAFMVLGGLGIALGSHDPTEYWRFVEEGHEPLVMGISWISVWVAIFPVVMPSPPRRTVVAAVVTASMGLASVGFWMLVRDLPAPPANILAHMTIPNYICVVLAFLASSALYQLGHDLGRAREMGSYRLEHKLGEGGMGEVWLASHRMLARPAAIKLIRPEESVGLDRTALKRFEMEAQATAALGSPHTIRIYDFGIADDGAFYYVMELLDGLDLRRLVERFGAVPAERAVHLLQGVCSSLREAHARGLVHRDVKPANVYVCHLGLDHDFVKVLDFGLVKPQRNDPELNQLTMGGQTLGTPGFLAPEMITGGEVDARADIYALGCVGFWLLTGRMVFEGESPLQTLLEHVQEEAPAPSTLSELEVPPELDALILRCLAKRPEDRPASVGEVAKALGAVPLSRSWSEEAAQAWWQRHVPERDPERAVPV